jgi:hypothetical protein
MVGEEDDDDDLDDDEDDLDDEDDDADEVETTREGLLGEVDELLSGLDLFVDSKVNARDGIIEIDLDDGTVWELKLSRAKEE